MGPEEGVVNVRVQLQRAIGITFRQPQGPETRASRVPGRHSENPAWRQQKLPCPVAYRACSGLVLLAGPWAHGQRPGECRAI